MSKRTLLLIALLLLAVGVLILSVSTTSQREKPLTTPVVTPTPVSRNFTTLVASPSAGLATIGEEEDITINIDTGANKVASVQLEMVFNPDYIRVVRVEPLSFLASPTVLLNEVDNKTGTLSYALGTTEAKSGRGELAKVTIIGKKTTNSSSTPITFLPKTSVGEIGNPASVLKDAVGVNFIIK